MADYIDAVDNTVTLSTSVDYDQKMVMVNVYGDYEAVGIYLSPADAIRISEEIRLYGIYLLTGI